MPRKSRRATRLPKKVPAKSASGLSDDPYLLDSFSTQDLATWNRRSSLLTEFRVKQFYYLEGLRAVKKKDILNSLKDAESTSITLSDWTRIVDYKYSLQPLNARGSTIQGGRFNIGNDLDPSRFPAFPALYIAENYQTAYAEKFGGTPGEGEISPNELALRKTNSFTSVQLDGELCNLFDLRSTKNLREFSEIITQFKLNGELRDLASEIGQQGPILINDETLLLKSLLDPNWRSSAALWDLPANSQIFAQLVREAGFEGVIFQSTKGRGLCVALFLEQLEGSTSYVCLADEPPSSEVLARLDSSTWRQAY